MSFLRNVEVTGSGGKSNIIYPFGEQAVGEKHDDVSVQFQYDYLDTTFDVITDTSGAGASVGVTNSVAWASTTSVGEEAGITSRDTIRYRPGHSGFILFTLAGDVSGGGWVDGGGFDAAEDHGFMIRINNTGSGLHFGFLQSGVDKGSNYAAGFDEVLNHGLTLSNLNIYMIMYGYLGIASPTLFVRINGNWKPLHTIQTEGLSPEVHTRTPVFPVRISAHDGAVAKSGSWNGGTIASGSGVGTRGFAFPNTTMVSGTGAEQGQMTTVSTNVNTVVLFRAKSTFKTKVNNVKAKLTGFSFSVDAPAGNVLGTVVFQIVGSPTITGTPTWIDANTNSSVMEYDHVAGTGAVATASAGVPLVTKNIDYVGANKGGTTGDAFVDAESIGAYAYAGDTFAIIAKDLGGNGVTVRVSLNWEELF